ncbi:GNAT family N-acetyltransferase [Rheinheimera hassiensis]|uniref:GNAT family N-acetyltransferase n=1 Tax=Rheinheimera hassiensis TaxID=1193627 RepID=UPI001F068313|nr:GNAT family N-acetyltransferase [Rheinheimera hassiensis]
MSEVLFFPVIETERLTLKPLVSADSASLLQIFSDPEVMKYWNTPPWSDIQDAYRFVDNSNDAMQRQESLVLGVYLKSTAELVGKCMLFSYDKESKRAEIGFGLSRACWGKGYITEAGEALIQYGFNSLGLRRIEAEIDPDNQSSAKALEKLGFYQEGLLRQRWEINGIVSDSALYGRLASDPSPQHTKAMHTSNACAV